MAKGNSGFGGGSDIPKPGQEVWVKDWFRDKIDLPAYALPPKKVTIIEERGKAYKVFVDTETRDGERSVHFERYVPKSVVETDKQHRAAEKAADKRYETGVQKYAKMIEFAKSHGVKGVREGLRKDTILKKLKAAGYDYKY